MVPGRREIVYAVAVMKVLALEPYFGGSHRAFLEGWARHSRHDFTILELPARKWKWRMRHAAVTLGRRVEELLDAGRRWDVLICSDMLNLAEFLGLAPPVLHDTPRIAYFHENQLTYPFRYETERDFHFGFTNMTTALAAQQVWFNTAYHRDDFLAALREVLKRMPDYQPLEVVAAIRERATVQSPGIDPLPTRPVRAPGPLRIVWAARWEHDKDPNCLFDALRLLKQRGVAFRVSVVGEQFQASPLVFTESRPEFADVIDRWGYQPTRAAYVAALHEADVFVSTAQHEFFGISVVEGLAAGCFPLLPERLAYPELLQLEDHPAASDHFYDGSPQHLAQRLSELSGRIDAGHLWRGDAEVGQQLAARYEWKQRAAEMDDAVDKLRRDHDSTA